MHASRPPWRLPLPSQLHGVLDAIVMPAPSLLCPRFYHEMTVLILTYCASDNLLSDAAPLGLCWDTGVGGRRRTWWAQVSGVIVAISGPCNKALFYGCPVPVVLVRGLAAQRCEVCWNKSGIATAGVLNTEVTVSNPRSCPCGGGAAHSTKPGCKAKAYL